MRRRALGSTGLVVSEIGFGSWQLGGGGDWGPMDDRTALGLVAEALEGGVTLFDTAPNYGDTRSEILLGEALQGRRGRVVIVSKFGHRPEGPKEFSVEWFWQSLDASLARLRTDYLDVLLLHNPDPVLYQGTDPLWDAMEQARREGRIRHYGASLDRASEVEACLRNTGSEVLEVLFNILHQDVRRGFATVRERNAGLVAKIPLDSGWLTGRFDVHSRFSGIRSRWTPGQIAQRAELVAQLGWLTADGSTLAEKALGFLLAYDEVSCVIPGIRTHAQLRSNLAAGAAARVSTDERERLESTWETLTDGGRNLLPW